MNDDELRTLLEELHRKIETTDRVDEKGRELLAHLSVDIRNLLERTGHDENCAAIPGRSTGSRSRSGTSR